MSMHICMSGIVCYFISRVYYLTYSGIFTTVIVSCPHDVSVSAKIISVGLLASVTISISKKDRHFPKGNLIAFSMSIH